MKANAKIRNALVACLLAFAPLYGGSALAQGAEGHPDWPGPGQLFVGTNYQLVDGSLEQGNARHHDHAVAAQVLVGDVDHGGVDVVPGALHAPIAWLRQK